MVASKLKRLFTLPSKKGSSKAASLASQTTDLSTEAIEKIERKLGYVFADKRLLAQSLTHPSFLLNSRDQLRNNQRLEFLGDSVIQLVLTETLFHKFTKHREGKLTSMRSGYARGEYMAEIARQLELGSFLLLKPKDRQAGVAEQDSALGDAFEALIGALYLDSDYETARRVVLKLYQHLENAPKPKGGVTNPKGKLQELIQPIHGNNALRYETIRQMGEAHNREFEVSVFCNDALLGTGKGRTKKEAEERAALQGLANFKNEE